MVDMPLPASIVIWRKSSASGETACVEVARADQHVWVRDSKSPGSILEFGHDEWATFLSGVRRGEFD